eukprot:TCALIF_04444-PA protein Name:"Similar to klhl20 Kelch-like protein 20 (Xenopus laevis)" AED:0.12 eAED:0.12 QI:148/1/0.88/1/0.87/0.88/9/0/660
MSAKSPSGALVQLPSSSSLSTSASSSSSSSSSSVRRGRPFRLRSTFPSCLSRALLTIKAESALMKKPSSGRALKCELEQMEHAFLDIDEEDPSQDEWTFKAKDNAEAVLESLNNLRKEGSFCDVIIRAVDRDFPIHKCVVSAVSNYFKAMFSSNLCESNQDTVTINGIHPNILEELLDYAYTSEVKITKNNVQNLLAASNLLEILPVRDACCQYLDKHMDENNSLGIQSFAEMHACRDLQLKARLYSLKMFPEIVACEEFLSVGQSQLIELISSDDLECEREEDVFQAVLKWLEFHPESREPEFHRVLAHVRLPLLSPYFLLDHVDHLPIIQQSKECLRLVEEAKMFHILPDRRSLCNLDRTRPRIKSGLIQSIVCVGGEDDKVVLRSVESWDPSSNSWKQLSCLPFAVSKHGLVVSGSNQMYMAGGEYPDGSASKSLWRFDPILNVWQELAPMLTARSELGLVLLDGYIYAVGGWEGTSRLDSVERYEIDANQWNYVAPMKLAVTSPAVVPHNGSIYVCGGAILEDGDGIDMVQRFNSKVGAWEELTPMLIPRSGSVACVVNGTIYVLGGWHASTENTNKVEKYDETKNSWSFVCPMHERRYRPGVAVLDGHIYAMGGEEGWDKYHDTVEKYYPAKDSWETVAHMPSSRSWLSSASLKV